jgi:uncharacterized protein YxjI
VPAPIGVYGHFTQHPQQIALKVRERKLSITGDDFAVKDAVSGQTVFQVHGKVFSLGDKKEVQDAQGSPLFTLRKKHLAIRSTYQGVDPKSGQVIFVVESAFLALGTKLTAKFTNTAGNGQEVTLHLRGDIVSVKSYSVHHCYGRILFPLRHNLHPVPPVRSQRRDHDSGGSSGCKNSSIFLECRSAVL